MQKYPLLLCKENKFNEFKSVYEKFKFELNIKHSELVTRSGNLEFLKYIEKNNCPINISNCWITCKTGDLEMLKYLVFKNYHYTPHNFENCIEFSDYQEHMMILSVVNNHKHIVEYLHNELKIPLEEWFPCIYDTDNLQIENIIVNSAITYDHVDMLEYLISKGCPIMVDSYQVAYENKSEKCKKFLIEKGFFEFK